jgi:hypothetical protein
MEEDGGVVGSFELVLFVLGADLALDLVLS